MINTCKIVLYALFVMICLSLFPLSIWFMYWLMGLGGSAIAVIVWLFIFYSICNSVNNFGNKIDKFITDLVLRR